MLLLELLVLEIADLFVSPRTIAITHSYMYLGTGMTKLSLALAAAASLSSAAAFAPKTVLRRFNAWSLPYMYVIDDNNADGAGGDTNDIYDISISSLTHQKESSTEMNHQTPTFLSLLASEEYWKEWHYSFSRNGFTDFLPQFADHIDCLAIDMTSSDGNSSVDPATAISGAIENAQLPWQQGDGSIATSKITSLSISAASPSQNQDGPIQKLINKLMKKTASIAKVKKKGFDCVLDGGVMNAVVSSLPLTVTWHSKSGPSELLELHSLMQESAKIIREFGIYIAITDAPMPTHAREYLRAMGEVMGMEWQFDLDGLSNEDYCVSVARKYDTGLVNCDNYDSPFGDNTDDRNLLKP